MRICLLDGRKMTDREALHGCLREALSLPAWYGNNLDALFDCLTERGEETTIILRHPQALTPLKGYGEALLTTLQEAQEANPRLKVVLGEE